MQGRRAAAPARTIRDLNWGHAFFAKSTCPHSISPKAPKTQRRRRKQSIGLFGALGETSFRAGAREIDGDH
jgi:hypothetical protein